MYKESTDELGGRDCHQTLLVTSSVIPPTKRNIVAVEGHQTVIGDGDTGGIGAKEGRNNGRRKAAKHFGSAMRLIEPANVKQLCRCMRFNPATNFPRNTLPSTFIGKKSAYR